MVKQMYRVIDSRGRVYLPKETRLAFGLERGSIVKLMEAEGPFPGSCRSVCFGGGGRYAQGKAAAACRPTAGPAE